jgi:PKD repeat protein
VGTYTVRMKLVGDYGTIIKTGTVVVQPSLSLTACIASPTPGSVQTANTSVAFDASCSKAGSQPITDYLWDWGDGTTSDLSTPSASHTYAAANTYTVKLTLVDKANQTSTPVTQTVLVTPPVSGSITTTATTLSTTTPSGPPPPPPATVWTARLHGTTPTSAAVTVTCPATDGACSGSFKVQTVAAVVARASAAKKKPKAAPLQLGTASFRVAGGKSVVVTIKFPPAGKALIPRLKRVPVKITGTGSATEAGGAGTAKAVTVSLSATVTVPPKKGHGKPKKKG